MSGDRPRSPDPGSGGPYCSNCGDSLAPSANYCTSCGAPTRAGSAGTDRQSSTTSADRPGTDRAVLKRRIARAARRGWELEHDFGERVVMVRRSFGSVTDHLIVALLTVWWTGGFGNALYGAYRYFGDPDRLVLRANGVTTDAAATTDSSTGTGDTRWRVLARLTAAVCWLVTAVLAGVGLLVSAATVSLVLFAFASLFAIGGLAALPSVRRRLDRRHPVTATGRIRSVDERAVVAPDRPCAACADPVDRGVERTYREDVCLFGLPLSMSDGTNYYCRRCANAEHVAGSATTDGVANRREATQARSTSDRDPDGSTESEPEPEFEA
ncbi:zinc ribbon domain-containing protein [Halosolutus amylolyticus]|uniref:Zinc ribbon domain-containing protein n=1 Tax=Halosolutus amylolyticus TaxID=2932267 RepID=A0ABD5PPU0_9EURY|nr:zinc-ribbon domain-containing protein [Halosolutus amylolyticus]